MTNFKSIAIFCGSSAGAHASYAEAARDLVKAIHAAGLQIVYGAGSTGLMGVVANEAIRLGVPVVGVVPSFFMGENVVHENLTELVVSTSMAERKEIIMNRSDAYIALPGGFGTFDELFEVATAVQLGLKVKPIGILNTNGYFDPLILMLEKSVQERFVRADHLKSISMDENPESLLEKMKNNDYEPPANWIEKLVEKNRF